MGKREKHGGEQILLARAGENSIIIYSKIIYYFTMDNMKMVEAMQDMFITYLKPIQEKIEILGLQNKVIQNKLDNMDLRLASLE